MNLERIAELRRARTDAQPLVNAKSGKVALRIKARSLMTEDGLPLTRYELVRPMRREHLACERFGETSWTPVDDTNFLALWQAEVDEALATPQHETLHLATGLLLPVWDKLPDDHVQVLRLADPDGRSLLGREIPAGSLVELGKRLGLDLDPALPPDEIAATVLRTGRPLPFTGPDILEVKRSLVNGTQRLEMTGFEPRRLPKYKAHGCFTEIIRYQTRLFVPVDTAADVLARLAA